MDIPFFLSSRSCLNCARSTTSPTIQFPGPWAERGRWRRKTWTHRRVGQKRRRKRRIAKSGRESVHTAHWFSTHPPPTAAFCQQDSISALTALLSGPHRQRPRDERGSQAEEGRERNQYVSSPWRPSTWAPRTLLTLLLLSLQIPSKTARARVPRATRRSPWKRRRAKDPNLPARRRPSRWNLSERPRQPKRWFSEPAVSLWLTSRSTKVIWGLVIPEYWKLHSLAFLCRQESRHDKEKKEKRDSSGGKEEKKQYP